MEDGPKAAEGNYEYAGKKYRLLELESEEWQVFSSGVLLGVVKAVRHVEERGPFYTIKLAGDLGYAEEVTDDWARAIETLIDEADI